MAYFGGGGVQDMHSSLRTYIDCFDSAPFPRAFPRGGGVLDQDPVLMSHFRTIQNYEVKWKETQEALHGPQGGQGALPGGDELENLLNDMLEERGYGEDSVF